MTAQIFIWWLAIQAFGIAGLPLARFLFRALPDHGYAFAKPLGLLLSGYCAWLLAMLGIAPFGAGLIVASALAVGVLGLLTNRRPRGAEAGGAPTIKAWFQQRLAEAGGWQIVLLYELIFLLALVFLAILRSYQPDPWGTERPMDFALFNAIRRSTAFPPHDPWMAGYSINYYYFGYMLMAMMALVSGLEPSVAFNLSLALVFALTALSVAGVIFNLIALSRRAEGPQRPVAQLLGSGAAMLLSVVLVLFAANQAGVLEIITGSEISTALKGSQLGQAVANGLGARQPIQLSPPLKTGGWDFDGTSAITPTDMLKDLNWWWPSRVIWDDMADTQNPASQPVRRYTITEFPFFSFWLGDMHPHVMALPFGLLALALALQTIARPAAPTYTLGRRGWAELALTGVVLGSLYTINSWDFPTYLLLFLGALLLLHIRLGQPATPAPPLDQEEAEPPPAPDAGITVFGRAWWRMYLGQAGMSVLASLVMLAPFYLTFRSLVGGKEPLINLPILASITRTIGFLTTSRTEIASFLLIFGLFLLPLIVYVLLQRQANGISDATLRTLPWATLATLAIGVVVGFPLLALVPLAIYTASLAIRRDVPPASAFVLWAFTLVCLICFGTEIIYIRDTFEGASPRMNTIFKFYYQAWLLWSVLAGYAVWWLYARCFSARRPGGYIMGALLLVLLAGALSYPWLTAGKALASSQSRGLVGQTPREKNGDEAAAIEWLRTNAAGDSVVLEAVGGSYNGQGFGGVSAASGLATVMGWPGHEDQWRGGDPSVREQIAPRQNDVQTIYSTSNVEQARELLSTYKVNYIYVGQLERDTFTPEGIDKLAQLGTPVFQQGSVAIYQVGGQ